MILSINKIGDSILETPCKPVPLNLQYESWLAATRSANTIQRFIKDMIETAKANNAVGLAANQVGEPLRIFVFNIGDDDWKAAINPVLLWSSPKIEIKEEGCLSIPKIYAKVPRPIRVDMEFYDENGAKTGLMIGGQSNSNLVARTMLHELDHLNGIFMVQRATKIYYRK